MNCPKCGARMHVKIDVDASIDGLVDEDSTRRELKVGYAHWACGHCGYEEGDEDDEESYDRTR